MEKNKSMMDQSPALADIERIWQMHEEGPSTRIGAIERLSQNEAQG